MWKFCYCHYLDIFYIIFFFLQVLSKGQKKGPGGVHLSLMAVGSDEVLQTTTSVENQK